MGTGVEAGGLRDRGGVLVSCMAVVMGGVGEGAGLAGGSGGGREEEDWPGGARGEKKGRIGGERGGGAVLKRAATAHHPPYDHHSAWERVACTTMHAPVPSAVCFVNLTGQLRGSWHLSPQSSVYRPGPICLRHT